MTFDLILICLNTAMRILERLGIQTSSTFVKGLSIPKFKADFFFGHLYGLVFDLETIGDI